MFRVQDLQRTCETCGMPGHVDYSAGGTEREGRGIGYWLVKTDPREWGWEDQERNGGLSQWDGVRDAQAQNYLREMRRGDQAFFFHSGKRPAVVGVVEVTRTAYPDTSDSTRKHCMVDLQELAGLSVSLRVIKADLKADMQGWLLLGQPSLSVMPVSPDVWARVCELGERLPPSCCTYYDNDTPEDTPEDTSDDTSDDQVRRTRCGKRKIPVRQKKEPSKRPRRLTSRTKNSTSPTVQEEDQSTESHLAKTYQRVTRRKVDSVEVAVIAPKVSKRQKTRDVK